VYLVALLAAAQVKLTLTVAAAVGLFITPPLAGKLRKTALDCGVGAQEALYSVVPVI
jgi:hypothetical protein